MRPSSEQIILDILHDIQQQVRATNANAFSGPQEGSSFWESIAAKVSARIKIDNPLGQYNQTIRALNQHFVVVSEKLCSLDKKIDELFIKEPKKRVKKK